MTNGQNTGGKTAGATAVALPLDFSIKSDNVNREMTKWRT
jgi:hypothetical protein